MRYFLSFVFLISGAQASAVTEVVDILQKMLEKSKATGVEDRQLYAKFKCYCDDMEEKKTAAIAEATADVEAREAILADKRAQNEKLSQDVAANQKALDANQEAQTEARDLREKEHNAFLDEKTDLETGSSQLKRAVEMLSAIGADQTKTVDADSTRRMAADATEAASFLSSKVQAKTFSEDMKQALRAASVFLSAEQRTSLTGFIQAPFTGNYNSQSTEIVGVLKSMSDTFESNLANAIAAEDKAQTDHDALMEVLENEATTLEEQIRSDKVLIGDNAAEVATQLSEVEKLNAGIERDSGFLASLTERCATKKAEYEKVNMLRANEEAAIAQAIAILNSDDAFATFGKVDASSFIQITSEPAARRAAIKDLIASARASKSLRLARIASALTAENPFTQVLKQIDDMILLIDVEQKADDDKDAWCTKEEDTNDKSIKTKTDHINTVTDQINTLDESARKSRDAIDNTKQELSDIREAQKQETATRTGAHQAFLQDLSDMQSAETLISKAIEVLRKYYEWMEGKKAYMKHAGKDSGGKNIEQLAGKSVEELEKACSENPDCAGFNSAGWLKSALAPSEEWYDWDGGDLYEKVGKGAASFVQIQNPEIKENEPEFGEQGTKQGKEVIDTLQYILDSTRDEITTATQDESTSQTQYETQMLSMTASEKSLVDNVAQYEKDLATTNKQLEEAHEDRKSTTQEKEAVEKYAADIEPGCTFMHTNIVDRTANRKTEKDSLEGVIEKLKGTPAFQNAVAAADTEALGKCAPTCEENGLGHAKCEACRNDVTVAGWCVTNEGAPGCADATKTTSAGALKPARA